jgi:cellobiose phosphorylase
VVKISEIMKIQNTPGLSIEFLDNGSVKSIEVAPIRINLKASSPYSKPGTNIYLRKRGSKIDYYALTGPDSDSKFQVMENQFTASGEWSGIQYSCGLRLAANNFSWRWSIELHNTSGNEVELDLIYLQDVGLKPVNAGLLNEYYVSQYLERIILEDEKYGAVACCRQNMKESTGYPWLMLACTNGAIAGSTDGMQFYGKSYRESGIPEGLLANTLACNYAGESPVLTLQEKPFILANGEVHQTEFIAIYLPDHPKATSSEDLKKLAEIEELFQSSNPTVLQSNSPTVLPSSSSPCPLFSSSPFLPVSDLTEADLNSFFGTERRHAEEVNGRLLSFFSNNNHIVLKAKEILADRPHAHITQAKAGFVPDENIMATTAFAFGVFNSHISQGNTNFNVLLSICTSQFNQVIESGQRIFVEIDGKHYLLGVPSAFEMSINHCRWIYKHEHYIFQVRTWTSKRAPQVNLDFKVLEEEKGRQGEEEKGRNKVRLIITHDFDPLNKWKIFQGVAENEYFALPEEDSMIKGKFPNARYRIAIHGNSRIKAGGDELIYNDHKNHRSSLFVLAVEPTTEFCMSFTGEVCRPYDIVELKNADELFKKDCLDAWSNWRELSLDLVLKSDQKDIAAIREILPWYGMNALTHFLTPYGLEQFSGAAWGTRDVSQGPVDLLLNLGKYDEAKLVLNTIFSNQESNGGWPQWWMFDSYANIRSDSSHDDIYYWCLIALASYIKVTGNLNILDEVLPYYNENGTDHGEKSPISEHVDRLITMITSSFIPGTSLVPFGGGDWNDSLQPVSKELARRMISSWTVEMNYQAFDRYRFVFEKTGNSQKAKYLKETCEKIKSDFNKYLVKDGVVAGYGLVEDDGKISVMLHPTDNNTGVRYSILPMERGIISEIFTKEQAEFHQDLIEKYLKGPDGARLMDRPLKYKGGIQEIFQRAESSTFFGREIGLMYVHEHIRYAESLAKLGKADEFVKALRQAIPVGYRDIVPCSDIRQSNCYYSSSDVHFKTRYEADQRYDEISTGNLTLRGGWRVYSSGPGIYIGLIISRLLGMRIDSGNVIIDPVLPYSMDGLSTSLDFLGHKVTFNYSVKEGNFSPKSILINSEEIEFTYEENKYRNGGAVISIKLFISFLSQNQNIIIITI